MIFCFSVATSNTYHLSTWADCMTFPTVHHSSLHTWDHPRNNRHLYDTFHIITCKIKHAMPYVTQLIEKTGRNSKIIVLDSLRFRRWTIYQYVTFRTIFWLWMSLYHLPKQAATTLIMVTALFEKPIMHLMVKVYGLITKYHTSIICFILFYFCFTKFC